MTGTNESGVQADLGAATDDEEELRKLANSTCR